MSDRDITPRSRRAVLGAALGGVAASIAASLGQPATANAADGDPVRLAQDNQSTDTTTITSTDTFLAVQITGSGAALQGSGQSSGVLGQAFAQDGIGIGGYSMHGSGRGRGVFGVTSATDGTGVLGVSNQSSTGVYGLSIAPGASGVLPTTPDKTGVYGHSTTDNTSRGVYGKSTAGTGVQGEATSGTGVRASASTGTALAVSGRATFSRSGRASVPAGKRYVDVVVPGGLAPTTLVVATLETYRTDTWVTVARKNYPSAGTVRIYLNKIPTTTSSTVIGWVAIN